MAPGTGCTSETSILNGGESESLTGSSSSDQFNMEDQNGDTVGNLNQNIGKPPRDHSAIRHCSSSSWLIESVSIMNQYYHVVYILFSHLSS